MRKYKMFLYTIVIVFTAFISQETLANQPEVILHQGRVKGLPAQTLTGRPYSKFLGIPYAKPPVGQHRFKEPSPAEPWLGVLNATKPSAKCLQLNHFTMNTPFAILGSEDCLYINVYTPKVGNDTEGSNDDKPLDVIAFIHGGAFMFLDSNMFDGSILLDRDVVLVSFNYRLGPLGFLSTGDSVVPGNNGMKDQVLALKWIQQNIRAFGGNPDSVTIAGFSAGGASVHYHVLSPLSKGLFKAAICISGSSLNPWTFAENFKEKASHVAEDLGCPTKDSRRMVQCLRNRPAERIVDATRDFLPWLFNPFSPYALVVEPPGPNAFLPDSPINIIKRGNAADLPMLFTFTKEEGLYPGAEIVAKPENLNEMRVRWKELLPFVFDYNNTAGSPQTKDRISEKIMEHYKIDLNSDGGPKNLIKAMSDRIFVHGIVKAAKLHATLYKSPVYLYRFSYIGKYSFVTSFGGSRDLGVSHCDDISYVLYVKGMSPYETEDDAQVSRDLVDVWVSFAAKGELRAEAMEKALPEISLTDIQGPNKHVSIVLEEFGEERFWDSLDLLENIETPFDNHNEL